tara:strand:- start:1654 stop:1830 length:177 start_codon:yes stop_codon:yes gene_type:complete
MKNKTIIILAVIAVLIVIGSINQSEVPEKGSLDGLDIATFSGGDVFGVANQTLKNMKE